MSARELPPCEVCLWLHEQDAAYAVGEGTHCVVFPEDEQHNWAGMSCCDAHYSTHLRLVRGQPLSGLSGGVQ